MSDHVYKVTEIVGSSAIGVDDAIRSGVTRAAKTLRNLDWFEVTEIRGHLDDGAVGHFQVTMKVGFRMDDAYPSHEPQPLGNGVRVVLVTPPGAPRTGRPGNVKIAPCIPAASWNRHTNTEAPANGAVTLTLTMR